MLRLNFKQRPTAVELVELPYIKDCLALSGSSLVDARKTDLTDVRKCESESPPPLVRQSCRVRIDTCFFVKLQLSTEHHVWVSIIAPDRRGRSTSVRLYVIRIICDHSSTRIANCSVVERWAFNCENPGLLSTHRGLLFMSVSSTTYLIMRWGILLTDCPWSSVLNRLTESISL